MADAVAVALVEKDAYIGELKTINGILEEKVRASQSSQQGQRGGGDAVRTGGDVKGSDGMTGWWVLVMRQVRKLEKLVRVKDIKIQTLTAKLQAVSPG
jgi:hypothetical protein